MYIVFIVHYVTLLRSERLSDNEIKQATKIMSLNSVIGDTIKAKFIRLP